MTTEAGKRLLAQSKNLPVHTADGWSHLGMRDKFFLYQPAVDAVVTEDAIAAIEAEAREQALLAHADEDAETIEAVRAAAFLAGRRSVELENR